MEPTSQILERERMIALFIDFENIAEGAKEARSKFDIELIIQRLLDKGKVLFRRAYADWGRFAEYKEKLHGAAVEMQDIPRRRMTGKNSADIRMVVDAIELCYSKAHIDTFALVTGDSDFSPLVAKLRENSKHVIGMGAKRSSSNLLVGICDEFIFYEDLMREKKSAPKVKGLSKKQSEAFGPLVEAIKALQRENWDVLYSSLIKDTIKRKRPSFDEGYYGFSSFSKLLEDAKRAGLVTIEKSPKSGTYVVTGLQEKT
ncbi:MAG: NYN domain-containing protein [Planctomycetota bacterium]|jgi:uncharacterized protein (TIGR00288 family)